MGGTSKQEQTSNSTSNNTLAGNTAQNSTTNPWADSLPSLQGILTQLNGNLYAISVVSGSGFTLTGIDSTGFGAYTSGGTASPSHVPRL